MWYDIASLMTPPMSPFSYNPLGDSKHLRPPMSLTDHVAEGCLILLGPPCCHVLDPPTGKEDATKHQIIQESSPMNMNIHTYSAGA